MNIHSIESKCKRNGVLLDTSLLLVVCIGIYDVNLVEKFKKTAAFTIDDFILLKNIISKYSPLYVSPHILAELSNLSKMLPSKNMIRYFNSIEELLKKQFEIYICKDEILKEVILPEIGFADTSIFKIGLKKDCVIFTTDWKLTSILRSRNLAVVNYNEIRTSLWFNNL